MRVDVRLDPAELETELDVIEKKLRDGGETFAPVLRSIALPGLVVRRREADGESYVYVDDTRNKRLAGCVVFNRLIEVDRRTDRLVRSPHARFRQAYQRRGLARHVYGLELEAGWNLVSGARQSMAAHALWHRLAARYALHYVKLENRVLSPLAHDIPHSERDQLHCRLVLLGRGGSLDALLPAWRQQA